MNFFTSVIHLLGSGTLAYFTAARLRDPKTRPQLLAGFKQAELGSVPFLTALSKRATAEGDSWLAEKLTRHASDEQRHGQIFAHFLNQLGVQEDEELPNHNKKEESKHSPYLGAFFEGYSQEDLNSENIDWIVFFGSTYVAESSAQKEFLRLANILPRDEIYTRRFSDSLFGIAQDETRHSAYLYEALHRCLAPAQARAVINEWQTRKVNAMLAVASGMFKALNGSTQTHDSASTKVEEISVATESLIA